MDGAVSPSEFSAAIVILARKATSISALVCSSMPPVSNPGDIKTSRRFGVAAATCLMTMPTPSSPSIESYLEAFQMMPARSCTYASCARTHSGVGSGHLQATA